MDIMNLFHRKYGKALCCAAMLLLSGPDAGRAASTPSFDSIYGRRLMVGTTEERYIDMLHTYFNSQDANGDGVLTSADVEVQTQMLAAEQRAQQLQQLFRKDLNGDGVITGAELRQYYRQERVRFHRPNDDLAEEARQALQLQSVMAADKNLDGRVTLKEAYDFALSRQNLSAPRLPFYLDGFAPAKKTGGGVAWESVRATALSFFASIDKDHDHTLSAAEVNAVRGSSSAMPLVIPETHTMGQAFSNCAMPAPSKGATVVLLSAYEAQSLSSVTLGSQDVAVGTATVDVAPGSQPLFIVITSFRPTIWRFTGAVGRIEKAVLIGQNTGPQRADPGLPGLAGATGLPAARVSFLIAQGCLHYFSDVPSVAASTAAGQLKSAIGRPPDIVAGKYAVTGFSLPSGAIQAAERGGLFIRKDSGTLLLQGGPFVLQGASDLAREVRLYYPGGVVALDPKDVIGSAQPSSYEVLPNQAGLAQLVQSGALSYHNGEFHIHRKIRFPAELYGAHAARFLLLKGVPKPDGDPGHSCVVSEETGQSMANSILCH